MNNIEMLNSNGNTQTNGLAANGPATKAATALMSSDGTSHSHEMSLSEVQDLIATDDQGKWDALVHRDELSLHEGKIILPEAIVGDYANVLSPTSWATAQMCGRLSIPTAYFRRCPPPLQDEQFNYWIKRPQQDQQAEANGAVTGANGSNPNSSSHSSQSRSSQSYWLMRTKDDSLRGVLSDRYEKLDNSFFLQRLEPLLERRFQVKWFALTDESLHLRLVDPTLSREIVKDDRVMVGLHISNSEVGKRAVTVDAMVWRLVCSNGLIRLVKGKSLLHQRHIAISSYRLSNSLERAMGEALTTGAGLLERMAHSVNERIEDMDGALETIRDNWHLSDAFGNSVQQALLQEPSSQQDTLYGLTNALTQAAQALQPDERYGMEVLAGKLLEHGIRMVSGKPKARRGTQPVIAGDRTTDGNGTGYGNGLVHSNGTTHSITLQSFHAAATPIAANPEYLWSPDNSVVNGANAASRRDDAPPNALASAVFPRRGFPDDQANDYKLAGIAARRGSVATVAVPPATATAHPAEVDQSDDAGTEQFSHEELRAKAVTGGVLQQAQHMFGGQIVGHSSSLQNVSTAQGNSSQRRPSTQERPSAQEPSSSTQWSLIRTVASRRGLIEHDVLYLAEQRFGKEQINDLTRGEAMCLLQLLQQLPHEELLAPLPEEEMELEDEENFSGEFNDELAN